MNYEIQISKRRRSIALKVLDGNITIVTPRNISVGFAEKLIQDNLPWINRQLEKRSVTKVIQVGLRSLELADGNVVQIDYLESDANKYYFVENQVTVFARSAEQQKNLLIKFAREYAKTALPKRIAELASEHGFSYEKVTIREQSSRWGSCSSSGTLSLNWKLILAPKEVMDYVIIHELAHTKHMNHSKNFWLEVARCMSDYMVWRRWLKRNGGSLG